MKLTASFFLQFLELRLKQFKLQKWKCVFSILSSHGFNLCCFLLQLSQQKNRGLSTDRFLTGFDMSELTLKSLHLPFQLHLRFFGLHFLMTQLYLEIFYNIFVLMLLVADRSGLQIHFIILTFELPHFCRDFPVIY